MHCSLDMHGSVRQYEIDGMLILVLDDIDFSYVICHGKIYSRYEYTSRYKLCIPIF